MLSRLLCSAVLMLLMMTAGATTNNALCMQNGAGGTMVLTKAKSNNGRYVVISTTNTGLAIYGTWMLIGEQTIMIIWLETHATSIFNVSDFRPCKL